MGAVLALERVGMQGRRCLEGVCLCGVLCVLGGLLVGGCAHLGYCRGKWVGIGVGPKGRGVNHSVGGVVFVG